MSRQTSLLFLISASLALAAAGASADSYRCGRKLIRSGDSAADVLRVCGAPQHKDSGREELWYQGTRQSLSVQRWYYRKSSRSLEHVVLLHRGKVVAIDVSGR
jgi:hypothetical protein